MIRARLDSLAKTDLSIAVNQASLISFASSPSLIDKDVTKLAPKRLLEKTSRKRLKNFKNF